ncbi:MAG: hypothetical protein CL912_21220 [Deltaproteobacteria bacterium]|nr:hypothetical protein [Deltaproteobacteria bacterium]
MEERNFLEIGHRSNQIHSGEIRRADSANGSRRRSTNDELEHIKTKNASVMCQDTTGYEILEASKII